MKEPGERFGVGPVVVMSKQSVWNSSTKDWPLHMVSVEQHSRILATNEGNTGLVQPELESAVTTGGVKTYGVEQGLLGKFTKCVECEVFKPHGCLSS